MKVYLIKGTAKLMSDNPETIKELLISKRKYHGERMFGAMVLGMIASGVVLSMAGQKNAWGFAATGAGVILFAALPLKASSVRHRKAAVQIYNRDLRERRSTRLHIKVGVSATAGALKITF